MDKVTIVRYDGAGVETNTLDIEGIVLHDTERAISSISQKAVRVADGELKTYEGLFNLCRAKLVMKALSRSNGEALQNFIVDTLQFRKEKLGLKVYSKPIDLGLGYGNDILFVNKANFSKTTTEGLLKDRAPLLVDLILDFEYKRV